MILFFTATDHTYTVKGHSQSPYRGRPVAARTYDWLFRQRQLRAACCVFTDFDRLRHFELVAAAAIYRQLREAGIRVLNDPARCCQRAELLHRLYRAGINRFRAYPAAMDPKPERFPVFLKCESDHAQEFRDLIPDQSTLDKTLEALRESGYPLHYLLVIEFANRQLHDQVYRRHTIYRIGERMIAANTVTEDSPFVKYGKPGLATAEDLAASTTEILDNPHAGPMRRVFELAHIEYGRADFGFDGDALAVYEINTNPSVGLRVNSSSAVLNDAVQSSMRAIAQAVDALDEGEHSARLSPGQQHRRRRRLVWSSPLRQP